MTYDGQQRNSTIDSCNCNRLMTVDEIAVSLNVGDDKVRAFVQAGMPAYKFGHRTLRFDLSRVVAWLDQNHSSQPAAIAGLLAPEGSSAPSGVPTQGAGVSPTPAPTSVEEVV